MGSGPIPSYMQAKPMSTTAEPTEYPSVFDGATLADRLVKAGESGTLIEADALGVPSSIEDAIAVQMISLAQARPAETTWKIAVTPAGEGVRAPMFPLLDQARSQADFAYRNGQRLEVEIALRLGTSLPPKLDGSYSRADIDAAVGTVFLGIEVLEKRISGTPAYLLRYADRLDNGGYVIGPVLPNTVIDTVERMPLSVTAAGQTIFDAPSGHPKGDVLSWLLAYANNPNRPSDSLAAGEFVTTGSLCGAVDLPTSGTVQCVLNGQWTMDVVFG
jgi:2-keto-4-pentenoate hydratase